MYFTLPLKGFSLELGIGACMDQKKRVMGLPGRTRGLTICGSINVTDGRTDRHRTTANTGLMHSVPR